jgi:flagellar FliJ protein
MNGPSFRFRLERVRALRERSEDAAKQALAMSLQEHNRREDALRLAEDRVSAARAAQLDATAASTRASELVARQRYLERTERARQASRHDLDRQERELEQRRAELTAASRDRQALERLKEHRRADHERENARREGLAIDEIATNGFRRRAA